MEDLTKGSKPSTAAAKSNTEAKTSNASTPGTADNEDEEGWETVRPRARSKYSPVSESSSRGRPPRVRHSHKTRFQMPSSAISLPTLSLMKEEEGDGGAVASKVGDKSKSKDEEVKTKTDAVKEESHSGDMTPKTEEETKTSKTEAEEAEEEEDEEERSADSALAKLEEGIAMSQLEEDALIKAIRETEQG